MFLFLSKLLPLLIYPIGFACLMLLVALILIWKRPRAAAICIGLAILAILVPSSGLVSTQAVRSLEWQHLPPADYPKAEAIVVLGGAVRPQIPPRPWIDMSEAGDRPIQGAQLYKQGKAPLVVLSGGRIEWNGGGPPESTDMALVVQALGVPALAILEDPTSLNTYENAVNVKKLLEPRGIRKILLVTSAMHMPRSVKIFEKQGFETIAAPTDFLVSEQETQSLANASFQAIALSLLPDVENLQRFTRVMKEYVGILVYWLKGWV